MSIYFVLLLAAAALYVLECVALSPEDCTALSATPRHWTAAPSQALLGALHKRVVFSSLRPDRGISLTQSAPPLVSSDSLCLCNLDRRHDIALNNAQITADDHDVRASGKKILSMPSKQSAERMAQFFATLGRADPLERPGIVTQEMARLLDTHAVRRRIRILHVFARWIVFNSLALIAYTVTTAFMADRFGLRHAWPLFFAILVLFAFSIFTYLRAHSALWPQEGLPWRHIFPMVLAPPHALRAFDYLTRELCSEYHWLPVAKVSMDLDTARELTYQYWRQLTFPATWEKVTCPTAQNALQEWRRIVLQFINTNYGEATEALDPPITLSGCTVYCPRCRQQYTKATFCSDCGIGLAQFDSSFG
jgi:hypothetical protein